MHLGELASEGRFIEALRLTIRTVPGRDTFDSGVSTAEGLQVRLRQVGLPLGSRLERQQFQMQKVERSEIGITCFGPI